MPTKPKRRPVTEVMADEEAMQEIAEELAAKIEGGEGALGWPVKTSGMPGAAIGVVHREGRAGRLVVSALVIVAEAITAETLRRVPLASLENSANLTFRGDVDRDALRALPPLNRSAAASPEAFSAAVAEHYKVWAARVPNPAAAMAAEYDVKVPTMHGWIREARLRGFLSEAKRGKA